MKVKIFILTLMVIFSIEKSFAEMDSPDRFYVVSMKGIQYVDVVGEKDEHGNYEVRIYIEKSIYPKFYKSGDLYGKGWWSTSTQQFYTQDFEIRPSIQHCNAWGEHYWGFPYKSKFKIVGGDKIALYQQIDDFPSGRAPQKYCIDEKISRSTCARYKCNKWKDPSPNSYMVPSKSKAYRLFSELQ